MNLCGYSEYKTQALKWELKKYEVMKGVTHEISVFFIALHKSGTKTKFQSSTQRCDEGSLKQAWSFSVFKELSRH